MNIAIKEVMKYSPVFFYGKAGSGKASLLRYIAKRFEKACLYVTAEDFLKDLASSIKNCQKELFRHKYENKNLLIIDDLQFLANKFYTQEELLKIMKEFQVKDRQIILAANRHPKHIRGLNKELVDSCYGGLMLEVKAPEIL